MALAASALIGISGLSMAPHQVTYANNVAVTRTSKPRFLSRLIASTFRTRAPDPDAARTPFVLCRSLAFYCRLAWASYCCQPRCFGNKVQLLYPSMHIHPYRTPTCTNVRACVGVFNAPCGGRGIDAKRAVRLFGVLTHAPQHGNDFAGRRVWLAWFAFNAAVGFFYAFVHQVCHATDPPACTCGQRGASQVFACTHTVCNVPHWC